jgi:dTDP-4-dehydrorhamnose reductase/quercetin dioxygenase-like cupin family protein
LACARNKERLADMEALGADTYQFEATRRHAFHYAMGNARGPIVVYCLPPYPGLPGGELVSRAAAECLSVGAERFIYFSSTSVYGEGGGDRIVDEDTPVSGELDDQDARPYVSAEGAVEDARVRGLDGTILRLASVYGPGRGVRERLLHGKYRLLDEGKHVYSRIHVDDVVGILRAIAERGPTNGTYCLADDRPCPQREYAEWLARHLGVRTPTSVPSLAPSMPRRRIRNRGVSNTKLKRELEYQFLYPSYREGELAIDRELGQETNDQGPVPLLLHRSANLGEFSKKSKLSHLSLERVEVAADGKHKAESRGETVVYVLEGSIAADNAGDKVALAAGDVVEVPAVGLSFVGTGKPAKLLVVSTRR